MVANEFKYGEDKSIFPEQYSNIFKRVALVIYIDKIIKPLREQLCGTGSES